MKRYLLTFTGADRPGLIAAIAGRLAELNADIEDVSMTRLSGNFALMLLARGPAQEALETSMKELASRLELHCHVDDAVEKAQEVPPNVFVSAVGPNRIGIVATIAQTLANHGVNITEMTTHLLETAQMPVYLVRLEGHAECDLVALEQDLAEAGRSIGVEVRVQPVESEEL